MRELAAMIVAGTRDGLADGRQSERAVEIARGVCRLLRDSGFATVTELTLADGRRADVAGLSPKGALFIVEVKSSLEDFRADTKWPDYRQWCDRLYFAVLPDFPREVIPEDTGLIIADRYGAEIIREAPETPLAGSRRHETPRSGKSTPPPISSCRLPASGPCSCAKRRAGPLR